MKKLSSIELIGFRGTTIFIVSRVSQQESSLTVKYEGGAVFWLRGRFDVIGTLCIALLTIVALQLRISQGLAAFALVTAQTFVTGIHELIWSAASLELDLSAVERIEEYEML